MFRYLKVTFSFYFFQLHSPVEGDSGCDRVHVKSMTERFPAGAENCDMSFALLGDAGSMKRWGLPLELRGLLCVYYGFIGIQRDLYGFSVIYSERY